MKTIKNFNMYIPSQRSETIESIKSKNKSEQLLFGAKETVSVLQELEKMSREISKSSLRPSQEQSPAIRSPSNLRGQPVTSTKSGR